MQTKLILPLAYTPKSCKNIREWRPFGSKNTLGDIVEEQNAWNTAYWQGLVKSHHATPASVDRFGVTISAVLHDLSELGDASKVGPGDFAAISVLLADLDAIRDDAPELDYVRSYIGQSPQERYLAQVSTKPGASSLEGFFSGMLVFAHPEEPPQLASEESFVKLLHDLTAIRGIAWPPSGSPPEGGGGGVPPTTPAGGGGRGGLSDTGKFRPTKGKGKSYGPPKVGGTPWRLHLPKVYKGYKATPPSEDQFLQSVSPDEYTEALSKVMEDVRHASIRKNLSEYETESLARMAVQQEVVLDRIEKQVPLKSQKVVFNALRRPVLDLADSPFRSPGFEHVELTCFRPRGPVLNLTGRQRNLLSGLGVQDESQTVVSLYTPGTKGLLKALGKSVDVERFSADLPTFTLKE